ncbi:Flp pilus assembly protein CpaB [Pseudarthrobacter sp. BIM B-2242]|uniref:Flp pilus assembly protein CpaB n=1 Tax=Pseudarthrobacter sp. BIM B-2242 TaxID=2772401 RepID=UPI001CC805C6|nr:RcpC/CpaB family pilus assembly protein [Pseudarthrobacter sp. BIM B-2242]
MLFVYVQGADNRAQQGLEPIDVLVVADRIPAGTKVADIRNRVTLEAVPRSAVAEGVLTNLDEHAGTVTAVDLMPGEQLMSSRLVDPKDLVPGTVPVPDGLEEVTFLLEPEKILGGRVKAGDKVTVFTSFESKDEMPADAPVAAEVKGWKQSTGLLFHDVLVTAVQQATPETAKSTGAEADKGVAMPSGSAFVTVARSDTDAAKMIFSAEYGSLWLSKQTDSTTKNDPPVTTFGGLYP